MNDPRADAEFVAVNSSVPEIVEAFLRLGRAYLAEVDKPHRLDHEKFLHSMLSKCGEPGRWLLLMKLAGRYSGLAHAKIDHHERPGWGYVLEFGIVPEVRRSGWGTGLYRHVASLMRENGASQVWLTTGEAGEPFWSSLGFRDSGETERGAKILVAQL